jgi:hypothetical protein
MRLTVIMQKQIKNIDVMALTISFYKYAIGWMDPSKTYIATDDKNQLIFIKYLTGSTSFGYLTALVPIDDSNTEYYSHEARKPMSYDRSEIPNDVILIHKINFTNSGLNDRVAKVVDRTIDFNPSDAGAVWKINEWLSRYNDYSDIHTTIILLFILSLVPVNWGSSLGVYIIILFNH